MAKVTLDVSDDIYDLISKLDLPEDPPCQGDRGTVDVCPCAGCRLYDKIVDVIDPPLKP